MPLSIIRPVTVKAIVTDQLKSGLMADLQRAIASAERELQQLEFQGRKLQLECERRNPERLPGLQQQLEGERQKRQTAKTELGQKLRAVEALEIGQEVIHSTAQLLCQVEVGQAWPDSAAGEIVLQDGVVVAIRGLPV